MRAVRFFAALGVALLVHLVGARLWAGFPGYVDLFLVVVVLHALDGESLPAMFAGLAAGLLHDALSGGLYGLYGFADTLVGYGTARVAQRLVIQRSTGVFGVAAFAAAVQQAVLVLLAFMLHGAPALPPPAAVAIRAALCGAVAMASYLLMGHWRSGVETRRRGRMKRLRLE
ncbi:MAG TPA: rod shape-determining protein MreD [Thermoanaerobaculia bacterium]|nr:rod shape-determining protein MreD [Thermoanaerobaculia bacterium]